MIQAGRAYVKPSAISGNGLFATDNIPAGEQILAIGRPLVAVLDYGHLANFCSNCFSVTATSTPLGSYGGNTREIKACSQCKLLKFCGKECQAEAWKRFHKFECKFFSQIGSKPWPNAVRAAIQIMNMRRHSVLSDLDWSRLQRMASHLDDVKSQEHKRWSDFQLISRAILELSSAKVAFTISDAQEVYSRILCNSLTLVTPLLDPIGLVLDPLLASANHSCDPNAYVVMDGPKSSFRTLRRINKDEEILVSYVDPSFPTSMRQSTLRERFFMDCRCSKCVKAVNSRGNAAPKEDRFLGRPKELDASWKAFLDGGFKTSYSKFAERFFEELPTDLEGEATEPYADARHTEKFAFWWAADIANDTFRADLDISLEVLSFCLKVLATSKRFPLWRQPYPDIRREYSTKLCDARKYRQAFCHGAKQYFYIDPVLFPETHHPLRVVHNANLAMLALAVATDPQFDAESTSTQDRLLRDVNFGVLIYYLFVEVVGNVDKSHGRDNTFAKMVKGKFKEVENDIPRTEIGSMERRREDTWRKFRRVADLPDDTF